MKSISWRLVSALILAALGGCSHTPVPIATSYPMTTQQRMQAAHHWQVLAEHLAGRIRQRLYPASAAPEAFPAEAPLPEEGGEAMTASAVATPLITTPYGQDPAVYVNPPKRTNETAFGNAFYQLLRSELVNQGVLVSNQADRVNANCPGISTCTPMILDYDVQVVQHNDRNAEVAMPGRWSLGAVGIWLVSHIAENWESSGWAVMPVTVALDVHEWRKLRFPGQTNTEMLITTTVSDGDLVVFGETNIYYVNTGDDDHYQKTLKTYKVVTQ